VEAIKVNGVPGFIELNYFGGDKIKVSYWNADFEIAAKLTPEELSTFVSKLSKEVAIVIEMFQLLQHEGNTIDKTSS
jgi:hypothetical protein